MGDIGVHAFNMAEYMTGLKTQSVLAELETLYNDNTLDVDGTALLRFEDGSKGIVRASQIATGEENTLRVAVYGTKGGLRWEQENPNYLYYMDEGKALQVLKPGHEYNGELAKISTKMAPGHPEGIFDSMGNLYKGAAREIRGENPMDGEYPTIREGVRGMKFIEATLASAKNDNTWTTIDD